MGHGGARKGAGRKPKIEELKLIESLDKVINPEKALAKLHQLINEDNFPALKLYFEYRFGKPKETIDNNISFSEDFDISQLYGKNKET